MERLTKKLKNGVYAAKAPLYEMVDKLGEYEDLEERLQAVYGECHGLLEKVVEHLERHEGVDLPEPIFKARLLTDGEVDKWERYKSLEEQSKEAAENELRKQEGTHE